MSEENENAMIEAFGGSDNLPTAFNPGALMQSAAQVPTSSDKPYLSFKDGEWTFGADAAECDPDALWAVNPNSFQFGLIEWFGSQAGGEILVPPGTAYKAEDVPLKFDPEEEDKDGKNPRIAPQIAVDLYCINGDDEGLQVHYKTSTKGGVDALNALVKAVATNAAEDPENPVAVVSLDSSSYMHKTYKRKTYVPVIKIEQFVSMSASASDVVVEEDEAPEPEKKTGTSKKRGKAADKTADDAPPARRRRA